jgi:hypothetical protein
MCLFKLFRGLNYFNTIGIPTEETDSACDDIYQNGHLTQTAQSNFIQQLRANVGKSCDDLRWYIKIFKDLIPDLYNQTLKKSIAKLYTTNNLNQRIDFSDPFQMRDIATNAWRYHAKDDTSKIYETKLLGDLKRLVVYINGEWGFKTKTASGWTIQWKNQKEASQDLNIEIGTVDKEKKKDVIVKDPLTAWQVVMRENNRELFRKDVIKYYSESPNDFSFFQGYKYPLVDKVDIELIQPWLDHVKYVICNDDEVMYQYVINWMAFTAREKLRKTGTMLFIASAQGSGKGEAFSDVIAELLAGYSAKNVTKLEDITGTFNSIVENKRLIVCNELKPADNSKLDGDALKSVATDNTLTLNAKHKVQREAQNVAQIILTTNHMDAMRFENSDRRFVAIRPNDRYAPQLNGKPNPECEPYFTALFKSINNDKFYSNLFTYLMNIDTKGWNYRNIPMNDVRQDLLALSRNSYEVFIQEHVNQFITGWVCNDAFLAYKDFATTYNYGQCSNTTFGMKLKEYTNRRRVGTDGTLQWTYILRDDRLGMFELEEPI